MTKCNLGLLRLQWLNGKLPILSQNNSNLSSMTDKYGLKAR